MPVSARAKRFWNRMIQSWGSTIAERYGPTCPDDWQKIIDRTDDERLDRAIVVLRQQSPKWPPTLGELEAAVPHKLHSGESVPDQLAQAAVKRFGPVLCEHQLYRPWSYPYHRVTDAGRRVEEVTGVVIPACPVGCENGRSHRILTTELNA